MSKPRTANQCIFHNWVNLYIQFWNLYIVTVIWVISYSPMMLFWYAGLSLLWPLLLQSTGSGRAGSAAMAHRPSRSATCGIFPDWGTNPCPLHWQADSQPLRYQGSQGLTFFNSPFSVFSKPYLMNTYYFVNKNIPYQW